MRLPPTGSFGIPRRWSNRVLRRLGPLFEGDVINVSGWKDQDKEGAHYRDYFSSAANYFVSNTKGQCGLADPEAVSDFEIDLSRPLPEELRERFDVVFNHTTLEHVSELETAFENLSKLTRDVLILVVPFAQQVHFTESYGDYWRFTPMGVRHLLAKNGLGVVYEDASRFDNAGIYVLVVGSKDPDRWRRRLPDFAAVQSLGNWIGASGPSEFFRKLLNFALRKLGTSAGQQE